MKMLKSRRYREDISSINRIVHKKSGVSLVEIIVALLILALAALPAVGTFSTYYSTSTRQMEQEMALKIAESVINLMQSLSYDMINDGTLTAVPLDIQTPDGTVQGTLNFGKPGPQMIGLSADGKTPGHPNNLYLIGPQDPLFLHPSKPIGSFYTKEQAEQINKEKGYIMKEDAGRGYRRAVPSPLPIDIIEKESIKSLLDNGQVVICAGGGGIPVIKQGDKLEGIAAVIDKDYASAKLAELIDADYLVILTAVNNVCLNYGKENEVVLKDVKKAEMATYLEEGHFAKGSMYPKVQAVLNFLNNKNKVAVIASLDNAKDAFKLKAGTIIH